MKIKPRVSSIVAKPFKVAFIEGNASVNVILTIIINYGTTLELLLK